MTQDGGVPGHDQEIARTNLASRAGVAYKRLLRSTDHEIGRWALALPREIGQAATVALVAVLLGLVVFGSWVAVQTRTTSERARISTAMNVAFLDARFALEEEEALGFKYRLTPNAAIRLEHDSAVRELAGSLSTAYAIGDFVDQSHIQQLRIAHASYLDATQRMFDAVDAGDTALASAIFNVEIEAIFPPMEALLKNEASEHKNESAAALRDQASLATGTLQIFPIVLGLGLLLVGFLTLVLEVNRRARATKSTFLARVSHELRTPLNSILGFSQLILLTEGATLTDKGRRYVDNIHSSGTHLLALINDVLDMSKVEAGKMVVELGPILVDEAIAAALEEVGPLISRKGLNLLPLTGTRGLTIVADGMRLRQILLNGLSNAIKFTGEAGSITIGTRTSNGAAWIEVTDTGSGIPAGQLARMFEDYEQADSGGIRSGEGTGLGLPLSKGLAEMMGGALKLTSREGQGTTYHVRMPLAAKPVQPPLPTEPGQPPDRRLVGKAA